MHVATLALPNNYGLASKYVCNFSRSRSAFKPAVHYQTKSPDIPLWEQNLPGKPGVHNELYSMTIIVPVQYGQR